MYQTLALALLGYSVLLYFILVFVDAPYGKRERDGWGPAVPIRLAWLLLELPSFLVPLWVLYAAGELPRGPGALLLLFWLGHYGYRSFVYPLRLRAKPGAGFKLIMLILGMPMNGVIGYLMASMVLQEPHLGMLNQMSPFDLASLVKIDLDLRQVHFQSTVIHASLAKLHRQCVHAG